jgi:hypothetical protein
MTVKPIKTEITWYVHYESQKSAAKEFSRTVLIVPDPDPDFRVSKKSQGFFDAYDVRLASSKRFIGRVYRDGARIPFRAMTRKTRDEAEHQQHSTLLRAVGAIVLDSLKIPDVDFIAYQLREGKRRQLSIGLSSRSLRTAEKMIRGRHKKPQFEAGASEIAQMLLSPAGQFRASRAKR